ncbi:hypothetical protein N0V83_003081 [Neocucurbitaria cava]|uniref:Uncharacterized protein n=1 Tax=Neocucurbitaria cava TaxID=798079 RepID=A0A9W9CPE5_9PLEO|nr:hypothetical protein N0V83_003081 [Neocucurbitaria cava]
MSFYEHPRDNLRAHLHQEAATNPRPAISYAPYLPVVPQQQSHTLLNVRSEEPHSREDLQSGLELLELDPEVLEELYRADDRTTSISRQWAGEITLPRAVRDMLDIDPHSLSPALSEHKTRLQISLKMEDLANTNAAQNVEIQRLKEEILTLKLRRQADLLSMLQNVNDLHEDHKELQEQVANLRSSTEQLPPNASPFNPMINPIRRPVPNQTRSSFDATDPGTPEAAPELFGIPNNYNDMMNLPIDIGRTEASLPEAAIAHPAGVADQPTDINIAQPGGNRSKRAGNQQGLNKRPTLAPRKRRRLLSRTAREIPFLLRVPMSDSTVEYKALDDLPGNTGEKLKEIILNECRLSDDRQKRYAKYANPDLETEFLQEKKCLLSYVISKNKIPSRCFYGADRACDSCQHSRTRACARLHMVVPRPDAVFVLYPKAERDSFTWQDLDFWV